jgi:hypothetical protein
MTDVLTETLAAELGSPLDEAEREIQDTFRRITAAQQHEPCPGCGYPLWEHADGEFGLHCPWAE